MFPASTPKSWSHTEGRGLGVREDQRHQLFSSFTGIQGLDECSPGRKGVGCGQKG